MIQWASLVAQTVKNLPKMQQTGFDPWVGRSPGEGNVPTPEILPGESHGQRSLEIYSPRGLKESDTTERLTLSLSSLVDRPHAIPTISSHKDSKKESLFNFCLFVFPYLRAREI